MRDAVDRAWVGGRLYGDLVEVSHDLGVLDSGSAGHWVAVLPYDEDPVLARFATVEPAGPVPGRAGSVWAGPDAGDWESSLDRDHYTKAVSRVRESIAAGDVYQVNVCRTLAAAVGFDADPWALATELVEANPAPFASVVDLPTVGLWVVSASPELFLSRRGSLVTSGPIKGTAASPDGFLAKDRAENVMIVDLVRNDLGRVCVPGSVEVPQLCRPEAHPGLWHLVSRVRGQLRPGLGWTGLLDATFPPGSVTGAPKLAAMAMIGELEGVPRSVYCGALGWVDGQSGDGCLSVAIRTFWWRDGRLRFGTGGGITWDSDARAEWEETELKASRLVGLATGGPGDNR